MIGQLGDILIALAGVFTLVVWLGAFSSKIKQRFVTFFAFIHLLFVVGAIACLYCLIFTNSFDYTYVWKHSALDQEFAFKLSCLWEGQEGSFLLWIFWNSLLIIYLSIKPSIRKALLFLVPIQTFLISMVLGVECFGLEIGSSPFTLLKDVIQSEVYAINPSFVPSDGQGMNALLQNYWMVIHPPIIFLGFAIAALPFCLCLSGVSFDKDKGLWVKEAFNWTIVSIISLGVGMLMGAYWAYETLNFGGFWNWDPVENAIYIPWVILIAALHLMLVYKKKRKALNQLTILTLLSYVLVIYSTFLTRSGILGDSSVHSFTDSGLSVQLLVFLLVVLGVASIFYFKALPNLRSDETEESTYSNYEFWMFLGVLALCVSAFQIFLPTSFPVFNELSSLLGYPLALATPSNQVTYYSNFQIWFGVSFIVLLVIAQYYFRKNSLTTSLTNLLFVPIIITAIAAFLMYFLVGVQDSDQVIIFSILVLCVFLMSVSWSLFNQSAMSLKNTSSSLAHLGLMVFFVGILVSQGYRKVLTSNTQFSDRLNRLGNTLLVRNKPVDLGEFTVTYNHSFFKSDAGDPIDKTWLSPTFKTGTLVAKKQFAIDGKNVGLGDKVELDAKNSFYNISIQSAKRSYVIEPRVQMNAQMGVIASPDINKHWHGDIYTHVSNFPDPNEKTDWSKAKPLNLAVSTSMMLGSKVLKFDSITEVCYNSDTSLLAHLSLITPDSIYKMAPSIIYGESGTNITVAEVPDKGIQMVVYDKSSAKNAQLGFYYLAEPKDWITIKSIYFPMINLVWLGGIMMLLGTGMSMFSYVSIPFGFTKIKQVSLPKQEDKNLAYNLSKS